MNSTPCCLEVARNAELRMKMVSELKNMQYEKFLSASKFRILSKRTNSSHLPSAYILFCICVGKTGGHGLVIVFSVDVLKSTVKNLPCLFKRILQEKYRCTINFLIQRLLSPAAWSLAKKQVWLLHCVLMFPTD